MISTKRLGMLALIVAMCGMGASTALADAAYAWGSNELGQLGNGSREGWLGGDEWGEPQYTPAAVNGLSSGVTAVAAGGIHSLALKDGGVWAWGYNGSDLGDSNSWSNLQLSPVALTGPMSSGVTAIAAGYTHSLALKNGGVWAWGGNVPGQLGGVANDDPMTCWRATPAALAGAMSSGVTAIAAGFEHSLAIKNGGVWVWGDNSYGQLGNGTWGNSNSSLTPIALTGEMSNGVTAISAGVSHSIALKDGGVWVWGDNFYGQLGNERGGGGYVSLTPIALTGEMSSGVTAIAAGEYHNLALKEDGSVWAWGANWWGQLGKGTQDSWSAPIQVDPTNLHDIVAIAVGTSSSYALSADGSLWVWGWNCYGELGLDTDMYALTPQHLLPPEGYRFTSINASVSDSFASDHRSHALATLALVPEPTSLSILVIGAAGLLLRRRNVA